MPTDGPAGRRPGALRSGTRCALDPALPGCRDRTVSARS